MSESFTKGGAEMGVTKANALKSHTEEDAPDGWTVGCLVRSHKWCNELEKIETNGLSF